MMDGMKTEQKRSLLSGSGSAEALRNTGYDNTAQALGELVDNSIQAGATVVKIIVEIEPVKRTERTYQTITRISVLDNGSGMSPGTLYNAILFGEGTHFDEKGGLGKFGVGLPQASLSQGTLIKVWSWQNGTSQSYSTGFDLEDATWRDTGYIIPEVKDDPLPKIYTRYVESNTNSGTIVQWGRLDRLSCTGANTLFNNSEYFIGRMYRYWINPGKVKIQYITVDRTTEEELSCKEFKAVDPLYVMNNTSDKDLNPVVYPMFKPLAPIEQEILYNGKKSKITIKASIAKDEIFDNGGFKRKELATHARNNIGLSVVREGRELNLDSFWNPTSTNRRDPKARYWGAEIDFSRDLDVLFGVTNDKQSAKRLAMVANKKFEDMQLDGETLEQCQERLKAEENELYLMLEIADKIRSVIKSADDKIPKIQDNTKPEKPEQTEVEEETSKKIKTKVEKEGPQGISDEASDDIEINKEEIRTGLENAGAPTQEIKKVLDGYVTSHYKTHFCKINNPGDDSFFTVRTDGGLLIVGLNTAHPIYHKLFACFDYMENDRNYSEKELKEMLGDTYNALKYMLISWARMEDIELRRDDKKASRLRREWGLQSIELGPDDLKDEE